MQYLSYIIIGIIVLIFFSPLNSYNTKSEPVNYILRSLYHADITHLAVNMFSLYNLSFIENVIGRQEFLLAILFIWIVSSMLLYIYHKIFPSRKRLTVGFSGVIVGLIVIYIALMKSGKGATLNRLILSIIPQFFVPGISAEGHMLGGIAGALFVIFIHPLLNNSTDMSLKFF